MRPRAAKKPPAGLPPRAPLRKKRGSGEVEGTEPIRFSGDAGDVRRATVYLHPGQLFASSTPSAVTTILGSCVAIVLWDEAAGIGGLNHYLLPLWARHGEDTLRFGNVAFERLLDDLIALGAVKGRLRAKVFGGACLLASESNGHHLGTKNVEVARSLLADAHIPIVAEDVGGHRGRKLIVHTDTGDAWVKRL